MVCVHCGTENASSLNQCVKCGRALRSADVAGVITCSTHGNRPATASCAHCGITLCDECKVRLAGVTLCEQCARVREPTQSEDDIVRGLSLADPKVVAHADFGTRLTASVIDTLIIGLAAVIIAAPFWLFTGVPALIGRRVRTSSYRSDTLLGNLNRCGGALLFDLYRRRRANSRQTSNGHRRRVLRRHNAQPNGVAKEICVEYRLACRSRNRFPGRASRPAATSLARPICRDIRCLFGLKRLC